MKVLIFDIHLMKKSAGFVSMKRGRDFGMGSSYAPAASVRVGSPRRRPAVATRE
jgi:hypothetical protein